MKTLLRADAEKSVFHSYMPCVFPVTLILIIFLSASQTSIAQDLRIKREAATGTVMEELGNHRVLINSRGQIVTLSELVHNDVVGTQQFQIISHTKQFQPLQRQEVSAVGPAFEVSSFIETNDQGYIMTGSMGKSPLGIDSGFIIKALKLRGNGSFEWERNFNGNADDKAVGVQQTPDGGFLLIANTLSSDINFQNTTGSSQIWLGKLDSSGNKVWGKLLTNTHTNEAIDFKKTKDGNYIVCGKVSDNVALGVDRSTGDGLILKFKEDGTIIWQQYLGGNSADEKLNRISIDESGNIFAAGFTFSNNGDFAPNKGNGDGWIVKLNNSGIVLWNKLVGGSGKDEFNAISVSNTGIVTAGGSTLSKDGDVITNYYGHTIWVTSFSEGSSEMKQGYFGHTPANKSFVEDIATDIDGSVYCIANSDASNVYMNNPIGKHDAWLFSLGNSNKVKGSVYIDANGNGTRDAGEKLFAGAKIEITNTSAPGTPEYQISRNGEFTSYLDIGNYTLRFIADQTYYTISPQIKSFVFADYNNTDSVNFQLIPAAGKQDLSVDIIAPGAARPGFNAGYLLKYNNRGTTSIPNVILKFIKDPKVNIDSAIPSSYSTNGDTLTWALGTLNPLDSGQVRIEAKIARPPIANIGELLSTEASISPIANDETPDNNTKAIKELLQGSFDPNDKTEFHGGEFPVSSLKNEELVYLIRFQNTGTDTAFNIFVRDTLQGSLDWSSLKMVAASHDYTLTVKNNNELEWTFNGIKLPDIHINEKASHGFIVYSVKPKQTLVSNDVISNSASIYFDFNLPVKTNVTLTKITEQSLSKPLLSGLQSMYCGAAPIQKLKITNMSSAGQASVTVKLNNVNLTVDKAGNFSIQPSGLAPGNHSLVIDFTLGAVSNSLSVQFAVTVPSQPLVKLNSNVSSVNNGTTAVVLTASVISGSGPTPLFTFALDRNFVKLLQAESSKTTLAVASQLLESGDNWIYIKMKTSESCFTAINAVDSVKIIRNSVTGIVDINFPTIVITAYPNPFGPDVTIKGLQSSARYKLELLDASGKKLYDKDVSNQSTVTFHNSGLKSGQYIIRIYDSKKRRLIGSIPLLHL